MTFRRFVLAAALSVLAGGSLAASVCACSHGKSHAPPVGSLLDNDNPVGPQSTFNRQSDPTGTNDSSAAFSQALAGLVGPSTRLYVGTGTYRITAGVTVPANAPPIVSVGAVTFTGTNALSISPLVLSANGTPCTPSYNPAWYSLGTVYWDPAGTSGGSNSNSCASASAPCLTFAEIVRRYGCNSPQLPYGQGVSINQLSAQTSAADAGAVATDPVFFEPKISGGGAAVLNVLPAAADAGVFEAGTLGGGWGSSGASPSAGGTPMTMASVPAQVAQGTLLYNSTRSSYAFVDAVTDAGLATLTQPATAASLTTTTALASIAVDNDWAAGDTIEPLTLANVNLKTWTPEGADINPSSQPSASWVIGASIPDPSGSGAAVYPISGRAANNVHSLCTFASRVHASSQIGRGQGVYLFQTFHSALFASYSGQLYLQSGTFRAGITNEASTTVIGANVILHGTTDNLGQLQFGPAFSDGSVLLYGPAFLFTGPAFGSFSVTVYPGSELWNDTGSTWATKFLTTGALRLGTATTGTSYDAGVWTSGTTITAANLDTYGGLQDPTSGARFTNTN